MNLWTSLRSNWPLKLASLLVGLTLWMHVKTDQTYERVISLPLQVTEPSGRFVVANDIPAYVEVRVMGSGKDLLFRTHHGRVVIKQRVTQREAITVDLSPDYIEGIDPSSGFEVLGIESPRSILLDFDYFDTREVPVISRVGINLRPGYTVVGKIRTDPRTVRVGGPRRYVRDVESVATDSLVLSDVANDIARSVSVELPEDQHLTSTPKDVTVRADVQVLLERRLTDIPVKITHVPRGVRVRAMPATVSVDMIGGDQVVSAVSPQTCTVELDYRQRFEKGLDDLPLSATLPPYVRLVRLNPEVVSLVVERRSGRR